MMQIRRSEDRGHFDHGWLQTWHTFSFAGYVDPEQMGFGPLRVINQDIIQPGEGFGTHPHEDMEIITYVLDGKLAHRDSTGNSGTIEPGEVQIMSAGRGITHSEFNGSDVATTEMLQIWISPRTRGGEPRYDQKRFEGIVAGAGLRLVVSSDGADGSLQIDQDARLYAARPAAGESLAHDFAPDRRGWVQVARGRVRVGETELGPGDGAALSDAGRFELTASEDGELLLFDLPSGK